MNRKFVITNSILWATAIIASAIVGAPTVLSLVLLPGLALISIVTTETKVGAVKCRS